MYLSSMPTPRMSTNTDSARLVRIAATRVHEDTAVTLLTSCPQSPQVCAPASDAMRAPVSNNRRAPASHTVRF